VRLRASAVSIAPLEINRAVEAQASIGQDINPLRLEVRRRVHDANIASLHEVVRDEQVLLIRRDLEVVRADDTLVLIGIVETLDVLEVGDIESGDVVAQREREVGEFSVVGDVAVDGEVVACTGAKVEEELGDTTLAAWTGAEGVDDPDLAGSDGGSERSGLWVTRDEFDVLDSSAVGDGDGRDDFARVELPEAKRVCFLDAHGRSRLEDRDGDDKVGGQDELLVEVDGQTVRRELLAEDVESRRHIFGPLVDDVEVGISLDETAWRGSDGG
jgi:hypothetical protein